PGAVLAHAHRSRAGVPRDVRPRPVRALQGARGAIRERSVHRAHAGGVEGRAHRHQRGPALGHTGHRPQARARARGSGAPGGIGVGIDYSLFILTRYREELRHGHPLEEAIPLAMASSGKAVFVSAMTVVVALAGTQLVNIAAFRSMGWGAMLAVSVASAAALT